MNGKLTLSIEKSVIEKAKLYAKKSGRSLSDLIESYLEKLIATSEGLEEEVPEEFKDLFGSIHLSSDLNEKQVIRNIVHEKHNR